MVHKENSILPPKECFHYRNPRVITEVLEWPPEISVEPLRTPDFVVKIFYNR